MAVKIWGNTLKRTGPVKTEDPSQKACVRGPATRTLPSCQSPSNHVHVSESFAITLPPFWFTQWSSNAYLELRSSLDRLAGNDTEATLGRRGMYVVVTPSRPCQRHDGLIYLRNLDGCIGSIDGALHQDLWRTLSGPSPDALKVAPTKRAVGSIAFESNAPDEITTA
jgi:hypothetical protein